MAFESLIHASLVMACLVLAAWLSVAWGKMDRQGAIAGVAVGLGIYLGDGWAGLVLLLAFFFSGVAATSWKSRKKRTLGLLEDHNGQRSAANVLANGTVVGILGLMVTGLPNHAPELHIMMGASLAAAASDTLSSELGNVMGSRYFRITTGRAGRRGEDGVISPEGTLIGLGMALLMGALFWSTHPVSWGAGLIVALAGFAGNLTDSYLGATLQREGYLDNHQVNLLNTLAAALLAGVGEVFFGAP